jgi:hypothetical protein
MRPAFAKESAAPGMRETLDRLHGHLPVEVDWLSAKPAQRAVIRGSTGATRVGSEWGHALKPRTVQRMPRHWAPSRVTDSGDGLLDSRANTRPSDRPPASQHSRRTRQKGVNSAKKLAGMDRASEDDVSAGRVAPAQNHGRKVSRLHPGISGKLPTPRSAASALRLPGGRFKGSQS